MKTNKLNRIIMLFLPFLLLGLSSCFSVENKRTTISVVDPVRHYSPILFGQVLEVVYTIENTGNEPLFVTDIHVSGGCELSSKTSVKVLPVKGKGYVHVLYDSRKNIGYVKNYVTIYANFQSGEKKELTFDLNVVPNAHYTKDYEEVYKEKERTFIEELVDGSENERKYIVER